MVEDAPWYWVEQARLDAEIFQAYETIDLLLQKRRDNIEAKQSIYYVDMQIHKLLKLVKLLAQQKRFDTEENERRKSMDAEVVK